MGGRITVESVVRCSWNGWPDDRGIRTLAHQCVHAASIGKSLGQEFLLKAPAPLLEQFSAVAGNRNVPDSGAMLAGLLHGFMIAFATRETEERALKAMLEVARICDEANNIRGTSFGQASE